MSAIDTAFNLLKEAPRFAVHRGRAPIGESLDPSVNHDYSMIATHPHNEILGREHGVFSHPIANYEDEPYRMSVDYLLNTLRNLAPRRGLEGRVNDNHSIIDMKPYAGETTAGNLRAADAMGNFYQSLEEANQDWETPYDAEYMDDFKRLVAEKYQHFNKPMPDWEGDDDDALIGANQIVDGGSNSMTFEFQSPHFENVPLEIADEEDFMHELITHRAIDNEDILPMYGNSQKNIKDWMAERVRDY